MHPDRVLGKRILLADDQEGVRAAIKFLLHMDQHRVTEARNGREALDLFRNERFDLVITDHSMPEMEGSELAFKIRCESPKQPIIMITAYPRDLWDCENPVNAVLNKPFSFLDLRSTIATVLSDEGTRAQEQGKEA